MREIQFRGKRKDNSEWVYGHYVSDNNRHFIVRFEIRSPPDSSQNYSTTDYYEVIPETVGQYAGLRDKNEIKIFEGDVVRYMDFTNNPYNPYVEIKVVKFENGCFKYSDTTIDVVLDDINSFEVIGNIHDNPEFLYEGELK